MRIGYKIFWVEDDDSWFNTRSKLFKRTLKSWGFELEYKRVKSLKDVKEFIEEDGLQDFDILLVDLKLNNNEGEEGNEVINLVRNNEIYTDVIFYSSAYDRVQDLIKSQLLEGVYISDRKNLETKFEKVAKTTIKKIQEVNTIRGLLMAETSDLDEIMLSIIDQSLKSDISELIQRYVSKKMLDTANDNLDLVNSEQDVTDKIKSRVFTSVHKAKAIGEICKRKGINLNELNPDLYTESDSFYQKYYDLVISTRNIFGHVKEIEKNGKKVLASTLSGKEEVFNEERCIEIRKTLIKYRSILESISSQINS